MDPSSHRDPFSALGLPARPGITDDEVRAAWRRIAAASHPDRADGGNPGQFAAAAAAYTLLRTPSGRNEALADLAGSPAAGWRRPRSGRRRSGAGPLVPPRPARLLTRAWRGRPAVLALRLAIVAAVSAAAIAVAGAAPATPALITGAVTWLLLTARHDLAPPP